MEYYIYNVPVFVLEPTVEGLSIPQFCTEAEETLPVSMFVNIDVVYIGTFKELNNRNAAFANGAIYMTCTEPTVFDMIENLVHEIAHSLETTHGQSLYTSNALRNEFLAKRKKLQQILEAEGFHINPVLYSFTEYNNKFDNFLANEVGYPTLLTLTIGLFISPYGATSLQEYFANGFEKYFLGNPRALREVSPILYEKIEEILDV
jgi:hypothetical protein